jgi:LuxR family transcriptional regulator, maltose regulon positive regulatory protein
MREAALLAVAVETDRESPWHAAAHAALSAPLYWAGEFEAAGVHAQEARLNVAARAPFRLLATAVLSWLSVEAGRLTQAHELAGEVWELATSPGLRHDGTSRSSYAYVSVGTVHAAHGHLDEARSELERAIEMRREGSGISPWPKLEGLLRLVPVLAGLGDREGATALASEVRRLLDSLPDRADAQWTRLARLERQIDGTRRPVMPGEPLTERERDVLRMLQGTLSLRDIGRELYLSPNTIKTHTRMLYRKLDVSDRKGAVARGRELGLI